VQRPFVICRLKKKTDEKTAVSTCDEGEASSYTASDFEIHLPDDSTQEVRSMPCGHFQYKILHMDHEKHIRN
jgi:hypothetical protein